MLYAYPKSTQVNRIIPKETIYKNAKITPRIKQLFIDEIARIEWQNKLSSETLNLADDGLREFQIFRITLKNNTLNQDCLAAIDQAIPSPIIFEIISHSGVQVMGAYKKVELAASSKNNGALGGKIEVNPHYFQSEIFPHNDSLDENRSALPSAISIVKLYEAIVRKLILIERAQQKSSTIDLEPRNHQPNQSQALEEQSIDALIAQSVEIGKIQKEMARLKTRIRNEKQFNKRVELNTGLKELEAILKGMI